MQTWKGCSALNAATSNYGRILCIECKRFFKNKQKWADHLYPKTDPDKQSKQSIKPKTIKPIIQWNPDGSMK